MFDGVSPPGPIRPTHADEVRAQVLRGCLDWFTVLWSVWVHVDLFRQLRTLALEGRGQNLKGPSGNLPLMGKILGRDLIFAGHGVRVLIRDPSAVSETRIGQPYGVEVQIQGVAFSSMLGGGTRLVDTVVDRVENWLFEFFGRTEKEERDDPDFYDPRTRRKRLDEYTHVGRFDIAFDVAFRGDSPDSASAWIERNIYANGHHDDAITSFITRARKQRDERDGKGGKRRKDRYGEALDGRSSMLGKETAGRTLYVGTGATLVLCVYERDKLKKGDWPILEATLKTNGWNGSDRIVRHEMRTSRAWLRDQELTIHGKNGEPDRKVRADTLTLRETLDGFPCILRALGERYRHTDRNDVGKRIKDRRRSMWQLQIDAGIKAWKDEGGSIMTVVSKRREAALTRAKQRLAGSAVDVLATHGLTLDDGAQLAIILRDILKDPNQSEDWERRFQRVRERYGIENDDADPPTG